MRSTEVRAAIIAALQATLVGSRSRGSDVLAIHRHPSPPESVPSRTAMVSLLSAPTKSEHDTCDLFDVTYQVTVYYPAGPDTEDRIAADAEQLYKPLWRLHEELAGMVSSEPGSPSVEESLGMLTLRLDVAVQYRLDAALI